MKQFLSLHHPSKSRRYYGEGVWQEDTFYGLLKKHASEKPNVIALEDGFRKLSWGELKSWVDGIAADLRTYGLTGGDRASIWMSDRVDVVAFLLACAREGIACNPSLHRSFTCAEAGELMRSLSSKALLMEHGWAADADQADVDIELVRIPSLRVRYTPECLPGAGPNGSPFCEDPDKVAYLAFTSGTSGAPKCVMHSDNTLLANARDLVRDWAHGPDTTILVLSPLSHHIGWVAAAQWLLAGCRFVTNARPEGMTALDWIIESRATYVLGVPTHAMDVLAEQRSRGMKRIGDVSVFYMAGAPIPPSVAKEFLDQGITPQNVYGMTENSSHQYTHPDDDATTIVNSCGRGGSAYEIRIFNAEDPDQEAAVGEIGQIGGRGGSLMLGYFGNQAATEASFNRNGWFMSGDLGKLDNDGNLHIEGRLKDVIIRGGHNIYPSSIEAMAIQCSGVDRVSVIPVPDSRLGERICIAVTGSTEPHVILEHLRGMGLSKFEMPEYFLRLEAFPLTPSGKILKRELIRMVRASELMPIPVKIGLQKVSV